MWSVCFSMPWQCAVSFVQRAVAVCGCIAWAVCSGSGMAKTLLLYISKTFQANRYNCYHHHSPVNNNNRIERHNSRFVTAPHCAANLSPTPMLLWLGCSCVQIMCSAWSAHHVVWKNSSAIEFDRVEIAFILALFYWLHQSTWWKLLTMSFRKCHILKPQNSSPNWDSNPHSSIGGRLGKQTC